jgi:hypothetical protein
MTAMKESHHLHVENHQKTENRGFLVIDEEYASYAGESVLGHLMDKISELPMPMRG